MPAKSKAQFGKMGQLCSEGKITRKQLEEFNKGVDFDALPERVGGPKKIHKLTYREALKKGRSKK